MESLKKYLKKIYPLNQNDLEVFKDLFVLRKLRKGDFFIKEGQIARDLAFLKEGILRAFYTNSVGKEYTKRFFTHPSIIGSYSSLITQNPSIYSQQALSECTIYVATYSKIEHLFDQHRDIERLCRKYAEKSFVSAEKKELDLALLDATEKYQIFKNEFPNLEGAIPQYYIASYLNISPNQLSRIRKKLDSINIDQ